MTTTTYYQLNIVEGTDIVNPLIVDNPNYEKIDEEMHNNAVAGVTLATEIANATVHAITRENSDCSVIRFIATSRWKAGDTATVDGVPVTALLPSGETLPDGAYVINANVLCILTGTNLTVYVGGKNVENASEIKYNDTNVGAELDELNGSVAQINSNLNMKYNPDTDMIQIYYHNRWNDWERAYLQGEIVEITLPNMTSNSQNGYVASASTYWNGYEPYKAFSPSGYWCTSQGNNSGWIKLEMPKVYAITSISYNILSETVNGTCSIESSEDGASWNTIVNAFTITDASKTINFSQSIKSKYIKFNITASNTNLLAGVNRIQIFGYAD